MTSLPSLTAAVKVIFIVSATPLWIIDSPVIDCDARCVQSRQMDKGYFNAPLYSNVLTFTIWQNTKWIVTHKTFHHLFPFSRIWMWIAIATSHLRSERHSDFFFLCLILWKGWPLSKEIQNSLWTKHRLMAGIFKEFFVGCFSLYFFNVYTSKYKHKT